MSVEAVSVLEIGRRLIATVPADPSDVVLDTLQQSILERMDRRRISGVVLDISTVGVVDSFFARTIVELGDMIRLMGGEVVVTGLQPAVALTLTELGLSLGEIRTAVDVEAALELLATTAARGQ